MRVKALIDIYRIISLRMHSTSVDPVNASPIGVNVPISDSMTNWRFRLSAACAWIY